MSADEKLVQLLQDTIEWASDPLNVDTTKLYSDWPSQEALLAELDAHLRNAQAGTVTVPSLQTLYAPTAGLCEVLASDGSAAIYLKLAARFDEWCVTAQQA